ncbi:MAG: hypothetical protein E7K72_06785, partial [Roseomonas mucosa]|nr:hypothetical protein [Roseomonas mucosa]
GAVPAGLGGMTGRSVAGRHAARAGEAAGHYPDAGREACREAGAAPLLAAVRTGPAAEHG